MKSWNMVVFICGTLNITCDCVYIGTLVSLRRCHLKAYRKKNANKQRAEREKESGRKTGIIGRLEEVESWVEDGG